MFTAFNHSEWEANGLKDFCLFSDAIEYVNQKEYGDGQLEGEWYYADEDKLTVYWGTFGNDNSPGASSYTHAEIYTDKAEFDCVVSMWKSQPEYTGVVEEDSEREELISRIQDCLEHFENVQYLLRQYDKELFNRWKAGGYLVSDDIVSMYPSLSEILSQLEDE